MKAVTVAAFAFVAVLHFSTIPAIFGVVLEARQDIESRTGIDGTDLTDGLPQNLLQSDEQRHRSQSHWDKSHVVWKPDNNELQGGYDASWENMTLSNHFTKRSKRSWRRRKKGKCIEWKVMKCRRGRRCHARLRCIKWPRPRPTKRPKRKCTTWGWRKFTTRKCINWIHGISKLSWRRTKRKCIRWRFMKCRIRGKACRYRAKARRRCIKRTGPRRKKRPKRKCTKWVWRQFTTGRRICIKSIHDIPKWTRTKLPKLPKSSKQTKRTQAKQRTKPTKPTKKSKRSVQYDQYKDSDQANQSD